MASHPPAIQRMGSGGERWITLAFWLIFIILGLRLVTMTILPMSDTSEPRYAETARLMAESGNWITPWFEPGVPFWGKPPLSFWTQAGAIEVFGVHDLAVRLPSWIALLGVIWLTMNLGLHMGGKAIARLSGLVLASMALPFISAGAVLTDPFLALGTTLALVALYRATQESSAPVWRWAFFIGLAIGLMAKGPVAGVLVGLAALVWIAWQRHPGAVWRALPWWPGTLLTALLVVPWYLAAERATPGFLHYFLLGEHILRFIDPGWVGDLYGNAHEKPRGTIWLFLIWASFPWGILMGLMGLYAISAASRRAGLARHLTLPSTRFLLPAALAPALFFSLSGNILWTYLLPGLPFLAILIAQAQMPLMSRKGWVGTVLMMSLMLPMAVTVAGIHLAFNPEKLKSAYAVIQTLDRLPHADRARFHFLGDPPFSARYYLRGEVQRIERDQLDTFMASGQTHFLAVRPRDLNALKQQYGEQLTLYLNGSRYLLLQLSPTQGP